MRIRRLQGTGHRAWVDERAGGRVGCWVAGDHEPTRDKRQHDGGIGQIGQSGYLRN